MQLLRILTSVFFLVSITLLIGCSTVEGIKTDIGGLFSSDDDSEVEVRKKNQTESSHKGFQSYSDSFDRVWAVVTFVVQGEGVSFDIMDKQSGVISGIKNLTPSTLDMLNNYSTRARVSITIRRAGSANTEVNIKSLNERKYKERDWRPAGDANEYTEELFDSIDQQLNPRPNDSRTTQNSSGLNTADGNFNSTANTATLEIREIQYIQAMLNDLGYSAGSEDGILGARTINALEAFQGKNGLSVTGTVDPETMDALRSATSSK